MDQINYERLCLNFEESLALKTTIDELYGEAYEIPICPSVISGIHIYYSGYITVDKKQACPVCANKQVLAGFNDLKTTHPELAAEWDYTKNTTIQPTEITYGSTKKIWWMCSAGHSYQATPSNRSWGKGCPICGKVKSAKNKHINYIRNHDCLGITHPLLSGEWDRERNGEITPSMVTRGSDFKAWWICDRGHSYQATVANRVGGKGCPVCNRKKKS